MRHVSARTQPHSVARIIYDLHRKSAIFSTFSRHPPISTHTRPASPTQRAITPTITYICQIFVWDRLSPYFAIAQYGLWLRYCPEWGNTLRISPYFAIAQYGLRRALFRPMGSIRALATLLPRMGQYAPLFHPGLRYATPRAVFWRPFRALHSTPRPIYHICRRHICLRLSSRKPLTGFIWIGALLPPALPGATRRNP